VKATVRDRLTLDAGTLASLAAVYERPIIPSTWSRIPLAVIHAALDLAGGDARRITTDDRASLVVHNGRVW